MTTLADEQDRNDGAAPEAHGGASPTSGDQTSSPEGGENVLGGGGSGF